MWICTVYTSYFAPFEKGSSLAFQRPRQDGSGKIFCTKSQDLWVQVLIVPLKRSSAVTLGKSLHPLHGGNFGYNFLSFTSDLLY